MIETKRLDRCETCRFNDAGFCHRFPPQLGLYPTDNQHPIMYDAASCWPTVDPIGWCGEWIWKERAKP